MGFFFFFYQVVVNKHSLARFLTNTKPSALKCEAAITISVGAVVRCILAYSRCGMQRAVEHRPRFKPTGSFEFPAHLICMSLQSRQIKVAAVTKADGFVFDEAYS